MEGFLLLHHASSFLAILPHATGHVSSSLTRAKLPAAPPQSGHRCPSSPSPHCWLSSPLHAIGHSTCFNPHFSSSSPWPHSVPPPYPTTTCYCSSLAQSMDAASSPSSHPFHHRHMSLCSVPLASPKMLLPPWF